MYALLPPPYITSIEVIVYNIKQINACFAPIHKSKRSPRWTFYLTNERTGRGIASGGWLSPDRMMTELIYLLSSSLTFYNQ